MLGESDWVMDGDAGVQSTVLDLARWGAEVTRTRVPPPALIGALHTPGRLADGTPLPYGMGQTPGVYRGLPRASHSGAWVGYRSMRMHFPTADATVVVACHAASAVARQLAQAVADVALSDVLEPVPGSAGSAVMRSRVADSTEGEALHDLHEKGFEAAWLAAGDVLNTRRLDELRRLLRR